MLNPPSKLVLELATELQFADTAYIFSDHCNDVVVHAQWAGQTHRQTDTCAIANKIIGAAWHAVVCPASNLVV